MHVIPPVRRQRQEEQFKVPFSVSSIPDCAIKACVAKKKQTNKTTVYILDKLIGTGIKGSLIMSRSELVPITRTKE